MGTPETPAKGRQQRALG